MWRFTEQNRRSTLEGVNRYLQYSEARFKVVLGPYSSGNIYYSGRKWLLLYRACRRLCHMVTSYDPLAKEMEEAMEAGEAHLQFLRRAGYNV